MRWLKNLLDRMYKGYRRYIVLTKRINDNIDMSSMSKSVLGSLLITVVIITIPVLIIVNMFIYAKLTLVLAIMLLMIVIGAIFLYFNFYYVLLKNYHPKLEEIAYKYPQIVESILISMIALVTGIIVISTLL